MKVQSWAIGRLKPYDQNPRENLKAVASVKRSIEDFGWRQPIVVDAQGVVIVGHTRLLVAQELGLKKVPVHVAELTPDEARAYRLADNRTHEDSEWNEELLVAELVAGRICYGMELDPGYCDVIRRRYAEFADQPKLAP